MINKNNIQAVLAKLGFVQDATGRWTKSFNDGEFVLTADCTNEKLIYPENKGLKVHERQICNFESPENFVVFECIHRLFEKGYIPVHIEIEPRWKVGHGSSGGRADILIRDNKKRALLIIECKTADSEFDRAWKDTLEDGAQLFSYVEQEKSTQFVALYTSNFLDDSVICDYRLVAVRDNESYLKTLKKGVPSFKTASNVKERFRAWAETYKKDFSSRGLFEDDIAPYSPGKNKYSASDLKDLDHHSYQKKYHEFATILRQHNVSGHENAFDKLVNLFLAKIVDESANPAELAFYWKGTAYDDIKSLVDRIQKLYKTGMKKFLNEDVTYIEKKQIDKAFRLFEDDPDATKATILDYFDQLKYYTNNDFAFIDVHNEKLFYQNAEVLLKIIRMLQDIKIQADKQHQFLGDLFEGFLDKGIKQSEGQFFTPTPIVKFLVSSLPLEDVVNATPEPPRVMDYACGAGHFLNEYCHQIFPFVKKKHSKKKNGVEHLPDPETFQKYYATVTGIEKEYRLSKVAKVSAFMYGQDGINIVYADALARNRDIKDGDYSLLITNPPYSVKGFLETLSEEDRNRFELMQAIDAKQIQSNNSIECFFVERAKQLLAPDGVAAIILPSSILSNGNIYVRMREILLKYFDLVAIAEFGSGTFGKTGTNTATLFLRRKSVSPDLAEHISNRVAAWFKGDFKKDKVFKDTHFLQAYCERIGILKDDYYSLLCGKSNNALLASERFQNYRKGFENSAEYKNIHKKRLSEKYTETDRDAEIHKAWLTYLRDIESDKLTYFWLAASNPQPVVLVKSPADDKAKKIFLGYEWSSRKGDEGIKYIGATSAEEDDTLAKNKGIDNIKTPLFNPTNLHDAEKINTLIRSAFKGETLSIPDSLSPFVSCMALVDMLDFNRNTFDKAIKTTAETKVEIKSKYELVKLGGDDGVCEILIGGTPSRRIAEYFTGNHLWVSIAEMNGNVISDTKEKITNEAVQKSNVKLIPKGTTLLSFKLSIGKTAIAGADLYTNEAIAGLIPKDNNKVLNGYLFCLFNGKMIDLENVGSKVFGKSLNSDYLKNEIRIPLPPLGIQQKIIAECEKVDAEYNASRMSIEEYKGKIAKVFYTLEVLMGGVTLRRIKIKETPLTINDMSNDPRQNPNKEFVYIDIDSVENGTGKFSTEQKIMGINAPSRARRLAHDKSILISTVRPNLKGFAYIDHAIPDAVYSTGFAVLRSKDENNLMSKFVYYCFMYLPDLMSQMQEAMPKGQYPSINKADIENFYIPVPPLSEQQRIVSEIEEYETQISSAQAIMSAAPERKRTILEKWLNN